MDANRTYLALTRKTGEYIDVYVGDTKFSLMITRIKGRQVKLSFFAPPEVLILRREVPKLPIEML